MLATPTVQSTGSSLNGVQVCVNDAPNGVVNCCRITVDRSERERFDSVLTLLLPLFSPPVALMAVPPLLPAATDDDEEATAAVPVAAVADVDEDDDDDDADLSANFSGHLAFFRIDAKIICSISRS